MARVDSAPEPVSENDPSPFTAQALDRAFLDAIRDTAPAGSTEVADALHSRLSPTRAIDLFEAQVRSRHLDFVALWLREQNKGFYTIGSSGHEGNAAVAAALRADRSRPVALPLGGVLPRSARARSGYDDAVRDVLLGMPRRRPTSPSPAAATKCSAARR